ncbi:MAG: DNA topoisomerase I [Nitrososphaerota archaeon]
MQQVYWRTLRSNGVLLPPPYDPKGLHLYIKGRRIALTPLAEEMAYNWAKKKDTQYVRDSVFISNFMKDFSQNLPESYKNTEYTDIDFSEFYKFVDDERKAKESMSKEERKKVAQERKRIKEELRNTFGYAIIDGRKVEVANWIVEPPSIFMGRGMHPLRGRWKYRVEARDITLNLDENAPIPKGQWGSIVHDHHSMWLARWMDKLTGKMKYVWPHDSSFLQQERNKEKYDRAAKLNKYIDKIRETIKKDLKSQDQRTRQVATVCYLIDRLGMRVGDEKDPDEADTVGATTLRVEHVKIHNPDIFFDFLGKDSVRWTKTISQAEPSLIQNMKEFIKNKKPSDEIFDGITSRVVNSYLSKMATHITAKMFRTFHATKRVEEFLSNEVPRNITQSDEYTKIYYAKRANLEAAILCNHKKTPPKNWEDLIKKKQSKLEELIVKSPKNEKEKARLEQRIQKLNLQLDLALKTKDYNLNTSLKNYIDPRIFKAWCSYVGLDWRKLYTASLQRKFAWVSRSNAKWKAAEPQVLEKTPLISSK